MSRRNVGKSKQCMMENLESRMLLTAVFASSDVDGTWAVAGQDVGGSLTLLHSGAGAGDVTGGSETFSDGSTVAGNGTWTLGADGAFTLTTTQYTRSGNVNSTRDFITLDSTATNAMTFLIKHDGAFAPGDANGTWSIFINGGSGPSTGTGTVTLKDGVITKGSVLTTKGSKAITGTYTLNADGNLAMSLTIAGTVGTVAFNGALNDAKDTAGFGANDLQASVAAAGGASETTGQASEQLMMVKSVGKYTKASLKGVYTVTMFAANGQVTFDGNGKFSGSVTFDPQGASTFTGTYTVSATGAVTYAGTLVIPTVGTFKWSSKGAINGEHNVLDTVQNPSLSQTLPSQNSFTTFTRSANAVPTLTKISKTPTIVNGVGKNFSLADLLAMTDAADLDTGDTLELNLDVAQNVTILINNAVPAPGATIHPGDVVTITPSVAGTINNALQFEAFDGSDHSVKDITMKVKSVAKPAVSIAVAPTKADEAKQIASKFTFTRAGGDMTAPLTVSYTVTDTGGGVINNGSIYPVLSGTVIIPANKPSAVVTLLPINDGEGDNNGVQVTLTVTADATYTVKKAAATTTIVDVNRLPVLENPGTFPPGQVNVLRTIGYTTLVNVIGATDPEDGPGVIVYKITGLNSSAGVWMKNDTVVTGTTTLGAGDELTWTPTKAGTIKVFSLQAIDTLDGTKSVIQPVSIVVTA